MTTTDPLAGFDLGPVLNWLEENQSNIAPRMSWLEQESGRITILFEDVDRLQLSKTEIATVLNRFPAITNWRTTLQQISGKVPTWFKIGTTADKPLVTEDVEQALSPTAIVPGYTRVLAWTESQKAQEIQLFTIPGVKLVIAKWMATHTLIHEFTHTLIAPLWYNSQYPCLQIPGQESSVNTVVLMEKFAATASRYPAISHYAAAYRPLPTSSDDPKFIYRVGEELCESVVAYILGYIYCEDPERCFDPFKDRPEVRRLVEDFLSAKVVYNESGT